RMLTGYDVDEQKFLLAHALGFDLALSPVGEKEEVDLAIEASGSSRALLDALGIVRKKGKVLLVGNQERDVTLKPQEIGMVLRRELTVVGTWNSDFSFLNSDWKRLLELEEREKVSLSPLISHRISLKEAPSFILEMQQKHFPYTKVIIEP
nr:zinc-binding dehydrogenase [Candidatus Atribacteria bacterium]